MSDGQRLAEIRARADAASPGPWESISYGEECPQRWFVAYRVQDVPGGIPSRGDTSWMRRQEAEFIAAAREDIPWLLDLIQQQAGVIADLAEESDAARLAIRYREALERIAVEPQRLSTVMSVAREALEGKP